MMDLPTQKIVRTCREAIVKACTERNRYTVNELLAAFDARVEEITQSEGPSKTKLPASPDAGSGP